MIFAHAPIILPAVLGIDVRFMPLLYAPLAVLDASLLLRIVGDLGGLFDARRGGALLNAAAIMLFAALATRKSRQ